MKFYRYEIVPNDGYGAGLTLKEFKVVKETPCGYWITYTWDKRNGLFKWVSKTSRKRYAYPTTEEALTGYIKRTKRRLFILKHQIKLCDTGLSIAEKYVTPLPER